MTVRYLPYLRLREISVKVSNEANANPYPGEGRGPVGKAFPYDTRVS